MVNENKRLIPKLPIFRETTIEEMFRGRTHVFCILPSQEKSRIGLVDLKLVHLTTNRNLVHFFVILSLTLSVLRINTLGSPEVCNKLCKWSL